MVDLLQAAQDAVFALLDDAPRAQAAAVRQHVPEIAPGAALSPMVIVGDLDAEPADGKDGALAAIVVDVHSIYRGSARRPLLAMMSDNLAALRGAIPVADGVAFGPIRWLASNTATGADGVTYAGVQQFHLFAEPA